MTHDGVVSSSKEFNETESSDEVEPDASPNCNMSSSEETTLCDEVVWKHCKSDGRNNNGFTVLRCLP